MTDDKSLARDRDDSAICELALDQQGEPTDEGRRAWVRERREFNEEDRLAGIEA